PTTRYAGSSGQYFTSASLPQSNTSHLIVFQRFLMKRTKIICTIGPATNALETLVLLGKAGMDVARLNFSHGTHADHRTIFDRLVRAGKKLGQPFGILQDLQGPKIRVGDLRKEGVTLIAGRRAIFTTSSHPEDGDIPVTLSSLHDDVNPREHLLLDDGLLDVEVRRVEGRRIFCEVVTGGVLTSHKGLNLPGTSLRIPALSIKDKEDAAFGVKMGVDFVALSFVRSAADVKGLRALLDRQGEKGKKIHLIAKIEKKEAVDRFDDILPHVDGIMIARGDMGIEMPADHVPVIQKQLISRCRERGVPVIVATQMLDSMTRNPRPTRAEVSDVANAVADHADAVMLSGETATGSFPVQTVALMAQTIETMERSAFDDVRTLALGESTDVNYALGASVRLLVDALHHAPVCVVTASGRTARILSSMRPETTIFALTSDSHIARTLRLVWGVESHVVNTQKTAEMQIQKALHALCATKRIKKGETIIAVSGSDTFPKNFIKRIEIVRV
ncbi:MAG: pyruvate kinase, partial [Patescibacteria group bacterium]